MDFTTAATTTAATRIRGHDIPLSSPTAAACAQNDHIDRRDPSGRCVHIVGREHDRIALQDKLIE
ncbi:hypothetical protein, partial [Rhodococcus sp. (in: high G+C Gram-positive bacteria)]|uniref:hypothetical protein n=1 Tax=Rhodococcus sp. TaxID=1831 RepID=UPI002E272E56